MKARDPNSQWFKRSSAQEGDVREIAEMDLYEGWESHKRADSKINMLLECAFLCFFREPSPGMFDYFVDSSIDYIDRAVREEIHLRIKDDWVRALAKSEMYQAKAVCSILHGEENDSCLAWLECAKSAMSFLEISRSKNERFDETPQRVYLMALRSFILSGDFENAVDILDWPTPSSRWFTDEHLMLKKLAVTLIDKREIKAELKERLQERFDFICELNQVVDDPDSGMQIIKRLEWGAMMWKCVLGKNSHPSKEQLLALVLT